MIDESKRWPESFPDRWASEWGEDEYGLWMAFHYKKVRHVMRWIEPGTFMMGSPKDEAERESLGTDETLHQVTLSEGFWLGATTVTQALWQAVVGDNPSKFQGDQRPVEQVSWENAQSLWPSSIRKFPVLSWTCPPRPNGNMPAGPEPLPHFFGDNISTDQVNYDGNHPYADGEKGEYRKKTVEVKALPCNDWGCTRCMAMFGNGAGIGTETTPRNR